jgi:MoxR-like ATPase
MSEPTQLLASIGVYGYDAVEPIILAALISEDPLLLIGKAGTGKTFLLNSLSEALGLEHRHYNASLIAFDDLVGFPYPNKDHSAIRYLETPATVWQAESVLIDEISRCKPEHQNRLFSLVHERRIQGLKLEHLRYRWAAMNPCDDNQGGSDHYDGSLPLDQALADRFAFVVEVPDWPELNDADRARIADPRGEGARSEDRVGLRDQLEQSRRRYLTQIQDPLAAPRTYALAAASLLGEAQIRISPRRVRQLVKNLHAIIALRAGHMSEDDFEQVLNWSIPHRAWGLVPGPELVHSVHRVAWDSAFLEGHEAWLNQLLIESRLDRLVRKILRESPDEDIGSVAVNQSLSRLDPARKAAFAFALYPAALENRLPVGREGINDLSRAAADILEVSGTIDWLESRQAGSSSRSPEQTKLAAALSKRRGQRRERAKQLFNHLLVNDILVDDPIEYEEEFNRCITQVRTFLR